jgi:tetratricopeptide (TPR) repeat protein
VHELLGRLGIGRQDNALFDKVDLQVEFVDADPVLEVYSNGGRTTSTPQGADMSLRSALRRGLGNAQQRLGPEAAYAAGRRYKERGRYQDALEAFTQARSQWEASLGANDVRTVNALVQAAHCKLRLGDLARGAEDLNSALQLRATNPGAKDMPKEADIKNQLAWIAEQTRG